MILVVEVTCIQLPLSNLWMKLSWHSLKFRVKRLGLCVADMISFSCHMDSIMHLLLQGRPMPAWLFSRYSCLKTMVAFFFNIWQIKIDPSKTLRIRNQIWSAPTHLRKSDLATSICAAGCPWCLFTCQRGRGLRRCAQIWRRWEQDDHVHYDQKDLCILFHWTGSISSEKSRLI